MDLRRAPAGRRFCTLRWRRSRAGRDHEGGWQKIVRIEKEVDLGEPTVAKKQEERPANAPTLRRPGEEMPESNPANPSSSPPIASPPPAPGPGADPGPILSH